MPEGPVEHPVPPSVETSAISFQQEQERQQGVEVSSSRQQSRQSSDIKKVFIDIKAINEPVRYQLYDQLLKMAPTNQQRLMEAYDIQEGKMTLSHFRPIIQQPQSATGYIRTNQEVFVKDIHPMDQIELHKQTEEMVYSTLADKTVIGHRLQNSLHNTTAQMELEKASSQAKDNRIKSLEEIIIELGHDPNDPKGVQALMNKKYEDITALRRQIKLPATLHPQTVNVAQQKEEQDVVALLMTLHKRLIETEGALEASLKEKQGELASQPTQTTTVTEAEPLVTTTTDPPTSQTSEGGASSSAPVLAMTIEATTSEQATNLSMQNMMKEIEALELQMAELKEAKEKLAKLEEKYDKSKQNVAEKAREVKALEKRIRELEKELTLDKTLAEVKKILWAKIGQSITD